MPKAEPICSAKRRPKRRASMPTGSVPSHMPITIPVIGNVAKPLTGASTAPALLAVETMTVLFPPASACATARTTALRRASASSNCTKDIGSATADMKCALAIVFSLLAAAEDYHYCIGCRSALPRDCLRLGPRFHGDERTKPAAIRPD